MLSPPAQDGEATPGQVGHGEIREGSEEATGCLGHKPLKEEGEGNGLEHSDEEKTEGICRQTDALFSSGKLSSWHKLHLERLGLDIRKNILVRV